MIDSVPILINVDIEIKIQFNFNHSNNHTLFQLGVGPFQLFKNE